MAVLFGALGPHELRHYFWNEKFTVFQAGVKCQFIRALGLLLVGLVVRWLPRDRLWLQGLDVFRWNLVILKQLARHWDSRDWMGFAGCPA